MGVTQTNVIVIGGGVAGLAAAGALARQRRRVILLEARARLGGRVMTLRPPGWPGPIELGAEFVHEGNAPFWDFLRRHRIRVRRVTPQHWMARSGALERISATDRIARVTGKIDPKKIGRRSFAQFLRTCDDELAPEDRDVAVGFVEGFEAAPMDRMSARAVAGETIEDAEQYIVPGGYDTVVEALRRELPAERVEVRLSTPVRSVEWRGGEVRVRAGGETFVAGAAVITLPLGVWQTKPRLGAVRFKPWLAAKERVVARMGMGHVIRLTLRLTPSTWSRLVPAKLRRATRCGFGFIHSRIEGIPVWWNLRPGPTVTGWAGGPAALRLVNRRASDLRRQAIASLAQAWQVPRGTLSRAVASCVTHNWSRDPFSRGAYSFTAAGADDAAERLRSPMRDTLFFAGEATADGAEAGTVHGAFASGRRAAREIGKSWHRMRRSSGSA